MKDELFITALFKSGQLYEATHMLILADNDAEFATYVLKGQDVVDVIQSFESLGEVKVVEVYSYGLRLADQLAEERAWNL